MVGCFVPRCVSGHRKGEKSHLFRPSPQAASQWVTVMRKLRTDKAFDPSNDNHRVCSHHFKEDDVLSNYSCVVNGNLVTYPRGRWTLAEGAIPRIFKDIPSSVQPVISKPRRTILRKSQDTLRKSAKKSHNITDNVSNPANPAIKLSPPLTKSEVPIWWNALSTKDGWIVDSAVQDLMAFHSFSYNNNEPQTKSILILFSGDTKITLFVNGRECTDVIMNSNSSKPSVELLLELQAKLTSHALCDGVKGFHTIEKCEGGHQINGVWRSEKCSFLGMSSMCMHCKLLHGKLLRLFSTGGITRSIKTPRIIQKRLSYYKSTSTRLRITEKNLRSELTRVKSFVKTMELGIEEKISKLNLSPQIRETITTSVRSARVKSLKGMRYSTSWLLESLLLRIKSPGAYKHIRESNLIPLPHPNTLSKLIAGQPCEFGLNISALYAIKNHLNGKPTRDRQGVLIFDEVQLRETINYNHHSHRLDGFIDYGKENLDLVPEKDKDSLANHALVIMYRPFNDSWVQPIAAFATKNAAKGNAIQKAIVKLESIGAEVLSVVCDGSTPNKSFWKLSGVGVVNGVVNNKIPHPCGGGRFLYFTCDVPHLIKCIRNHCLKYKTFKVQLTRFFESKVDTRFYEKLFLEDGRRMFGLVPKNVPN